MKKYQLKSNRRDRSAGNGSFFTSSVAGAVALLSSLAFLVIAPGFFTPHSAFADSINMTVSDKIETNILPSASGATTGSSSSTATNISITTDSVRGYTLSLVGTGGSAAVLNGATSGTNLTSISEAKASLNDFSANTWGYKPLKKSGANWIATGDANGNFLPGPTTTGDTIDTTSSANADANIYSISVGAKVSFAQAVDSYSNTFVLVAVGNPTPYSITYNKNTEDTVTDLPSPNPQVGSTFSDSVLLSASTPARDGYNFLNWCTTQTADDDTCTGISYSPGDAINIDRAAASNDITLYAVWESALTTFDQAFAAAGKTKDATTNLYKMQDMSTAICAAVTTGEIGSLVDTRSGNEVYYVGKLADNKCWMLDNLRLGGTSTTALTPADTNIASNYTLPASGTGNFTASTGYKNAAINTASKDNTTTSYGSGSGKIGTYYNYCAASAGTYCYASGKGTGNAQYDVCPKGWRMPTGGSSGEYEALYTAYGSNQANFKAALSTPLSGNFYNGLVYDQGSVGGFWSSTYNQGSNMYVLYVGSSYVYPSHVYPRYLGNSVRCVAQ